MSKSDFDREVEKNNKHIFKVRFKFGENRHTEKFSIDKKDLDFAKNLGLIEFNEKGYANYFDWKPLGGADGIRGGVKKVERIETDDKYIYAITKEKIYSLPKYLESKLKRKDYILFGYREE